MAHRQRFLCTVGSDGELTLPPEVLIALKVGPFENVVLTIMDGEVRMEPATGLEKYDAAIPALDPPRASLLPIGPMQMPGQGKNHSPRVEPKMSIPGLGDEPILPARKRGDK